MSTLFACVTAANIVMLVFLTILYKGAQIQIKHFNRAGELYNEISEILSPIATRHEEEAINEKVSELVRISNRLHTGSEKVTA